MIKSKYIDKIIALCLVLAVLVSCGYYYGLSTGVVQAKEHNAEYIEKLFNDEIVHSIDIQISEKDWDNLLKNAINEEYYLCDVVIDGELVSNVGIRAKGNTSLSQIVNSDSDRYSFKIEFDHYNVSNLYYGLDKLALNNLMSDASYMKDYITYDMMNFIGANAPYSAFMNITVNGEPWGLYLGVECIDQSFLTRCYGSNYGELYKPESMQMGAGGKGGQDKINLNDLSFLNQENGDFSIPDNAMQGIPPMGDMSNKGNRPNMGDRPAMGDRPNTGDSSNIEDERPTKGSIIENFPSQKGIANSLAGDGGSDLVYIDDNLDNYSTLLNSSKTNSTIADKIRLINSLQILSTGENLSSVIDIENTLKYWVVHNFVCNNDSYTGNMLHNYYLYEKNGVMTMFPWDYNLAFGGFAMGLKWQGDLGLDSTTIMINKGIDAPLNSGTEDERPFWGKLIQNNEYKELYHKYFEEFIKDYFVSGYFENKITQVCSLIAPYVENDVSAFYTIDNFNIATSTLKEVCILRSKSILKQLSGEISITGDSIDNYIDGSHLDLKNLGTQGNNFGFEPKEDNSVKTIVPVVPNYM